MENLKFRAWHKEYEEYLRISQIDLYEKVVWLFDENINDFSWSPFNELTIEQYTGLKDKNGKEIYVGDIVRYDRNIGSTIDGYRFVVAYEEGQVFLDHKFSECKNIDWDLVTIVGNIHENKELLD